jgi:tetratricopeptide (TPR) repeat protein
MADTKPANEAEKPLSDNPHPLPSTKRDSVEAEMGELREDVAEEDQEVLADEGETLFSFHASESSVDTEPTHAPEVAPERSDAAARSEVSLARRGLPFQVLSSTAPDERYEILSEIARGGMGSILHIVDHDLRRSMAMKVILGDERSGVVERFVEEAQITGQLEHPNIVPVHEIGLDPRGKVYFTMKLVKGDSLEKIIRGLAADDPAYMKSYPLSRLLEIFIKSCDAVRFAHSRGVIHRDIKPENIMVGAFGEVMVMDWGLAKVKGQKATSSEAVATVRSERDEGKTLSGQVLGTPSYMPPEQADGRMEDVDERSDVFSLGGLLYSLLVHDAPYTGTTVVNIMAKAVKGEVEPPSERNPAKAVPPELESICLRALAPEQKDRYGTVKEIIDDVRAFLDHRAVSVHRYTIRENLFRFLGRHPAASLAGAVALVLLCAGGAVVSVMAAESRAVEARRKAAVAETANERLRADVIERDKHIALQRASDAESALNKGRLVSALLRSASVELKGPALRLKSIYYSGLPAERKKELTDRVWPRVEAFEANVPADPASRATWLAAKGWLRRYTGDRAGATALYEESRKTDPDVAYADLFEAMDAFAAYLMFQGFPAFTSSNAEFRWHGIRGENSRMKKERARFEKAIALARVAPVWGESSSDAFLESLKGFKALHRRDLAEAEKGLTRALSVPEMVWIQEDIHEARARVRLLANKFDEAIEDLDMVLAVNPRNLRVLSFKAKGWLTKSLYETTKGLDTLGSLREAVETYSLILKEAPGWRGMYHSRGMALSNLGEALHKTGEDPRPALERSLADYTRAIAMRPVVAHDYNMAVAYNGRGITHLNLARWAMKEKKDATALLHKALDDFMGALYSKALYRSGHANFKNTLFNLVTYEASHGKAPGRFFDDLLARLRDEGQKAGPIGKWRSRMMLGLVHTFLGYPVAAADFFETAHANYQRAMKEGDRQMRGGQTLTQLERWRDGARKKASLPAWQRKTDQAALLIRLGDYAAARTAYLEAVKTAEEEGAFEKKENKPSLAGVHYDLACLHSLASAGEGELRGKKTRVPKDDAKALRTLALTHLTRSFALGWSDLAHMAKDPDLAPLRDLPAYKALLQKYADRTPKEGD